MLIKKAAKKAKAQTFMGWALICFSSLVLLIALNSFLYYCPQMFNISGAGYERLYDLTSKFLSYFHSFDMLYDVAPIVSYPTLMKMENIALTTIINETFDIVSALGLFVVGVMMISSSSHLSHKITIAKAKMQKSTQSLNLAEVVLEKRDIWYQQPIGIVAFIISIYQIMEVLSYIVTNILELNL